MSRNIHWNVFEVIRECVNPIGPPCTYLICRAPPPSPLLVQAHEEGGDGGEERGLPQRDRGQRGREGVEEWLGGHVGHVGGEGGAAGGALHQDGEEGDHKAGIIKEA